MVTRQAGVLGAWRGPHAPPSGRRLLDGCINYARRLHRATIGFEGDGQRHEGRPTAWRLLWLDQRYGSSVIEATEAPGSHEEAMGSDAPSACGGLLLASSPRIRPDPSERLAEQMFDARAAELRVAAQLGQHGLHLTLAKAEMPQGGEDLGMHVDESWRHRAAVGGTIRVPEAEGPFMLAVDEQLAAMGGSMMG